MPELLAYNAVTILIHNGGQYSLQQTAKSYNIKEQLKKDDVYMRLMKIINWH